MAGPPFQDFMLPVLDQAGDGKDHAVSGCTNSDATGQPPSSLRGTSRSEGHLMWAAARIKGD